MAGATSRPGTSAPTIYEATRATDGTGAIRKGKPLIKLQAEVRRQAGLDIVVCGQDEVDNYLLAGEIEDAIGPRTHHKAHPINAGPQALPHFQQRRKPPSGHSFYETATKRAL